jgi:hypothetical protein
MPEDALLRARAAMIGKHCCARVPRGGWSLCSSGTGHPADAKILLVDPDRQQETIKKNDPQNLMMKAIDDGQKITDEQLDQSIKSAFHSGLFTLSEIVFDKEHRQSAVSYSFVCGGLCGNGNTLVLKKVGHIWKVAKRCGGWVS